MASMPNLATTPDFNVNFPFSSQTILDKLYITVEDSLNFVGRTQQYK